LCFQGFTEELNSLPGKYAPPSGALLIAKVNEITAGCVALRKIGEGVCEMKRLYVKPEFRGLRLGKTLTVKIIDEAKRLGYSKMRLDILEKLKKAMAIYESLGFRKIPPYYDNPIPGATYWELDLLNEEEKIL
jgi:ribosomal protein S18 acetylase RimI-like enzyme